MRVPSTATRTPLRRCVMCSAAAGVGASVTRPARIKHDRLRGATKSRRALMPSTRADSEPTSPQRISATCSGCHGDVRLTDTHRLPVSVVTDFRSSFHGLAGLLGDRRVADCASCHGAHEIRPSWDPQSRIHPANIPQTCGSCHAGVTSGFARGGIHHVPATLGHRAVDVVRYMYLTMIVVVDSLMGSTTRWTSRDDGVRRKCVSPFKRPVTQRIRATPTLLLS